MKQIHVDRFKELITYLKQPQEKLYHDKFDFSFEHRVTDCGSSGCAIGEFRYIWPQEFKFFWPYAMQIEKWFGISIDEKFFFCFIPNSPKLPGTKWKGVEL